ncbi:MAG TPA: hypothetical protein VND15_03615 [Candidatus Acidoferrales bacterium]|nr:hypothetical protein [Candidatus Acidoferrales bacterium]
MTISVPQYALRAYALFYTRHGSTGEFGQGDLDWMVGQSMRKKIFSSLLRSGWITKRSRATYACVSPERAVRGLLEFRVPEVIKAASRPYAFTGLSAIEIWSDYSYVQRGMERSPYFINVLRKDLTYWRAFFNKHDVPFYLDEGTTIGEYVILIPVERVSATEMRGLKVIGLAETERLAKSNEIYSYVYDYMRRKYGSATA